MTKAQEKAAAVLAAKREAFAQKVFRLLGHLVGKRLDRAALNAAFEAGKSADDYAAKVAALEPVGRVVHPLKVVAVAHAHKSAEKVVERVRADLEANGWDRVKAAPYPQSNMGRAAHQMDLAKYNLYSTLTETAKASHRMGEPQICTMSDSGIARFIAQAEKDAAFQYDAFICKLVAKVGEVIDARLEGDHVWSHSILYVTKREGGETFGERWKTQQIVNFSKFGSGFYQWPTRKVK